MTNILFAVLALLISTQCLGANISLNEDERIVIAGEIKVGDYNKLIKFLKKDNLQFFLDSAVILNSPGGDIPETLKIANLMNKSHVTTAIKYGGSCFSSCFLLWAAGSKRLLNYESQLGVHPLDQSEWEYDETFPEERITKISKNAEAFLTKVGVPSSIINKMNQKPTYDYLIIDSDFLEKEGLGNTLYYQPNFLKAVEIKCGKAPSHKNPTNKTENDEPLVKDEEWDRCSRKVKKMIQSQSKTEISKLMFLSK